MGARRERKGTPKGSQGRLNDPKPNPEPEKNQLNSLLHLGLSAQLPKGAEDAQFKSSVLPQPPPKTPYLPRPGAGILPQAIEINKK